jgi:hypothetical protein
MSTPLSSIKRWTILTHRWLGIAFCLLFAMWFVSGVVMIYVPYPRLTETERMGGLAALKPESVRISLAQALSAAGLDSFPREARLGMMLERPVYRFLDWDETWRVVDADTGTLIAGIDAEAAARIAVAFAARSGWTAQPAAVTRIRNDQWTVPQGLDPYRPLYKVPLADKQGTVLYVSERTGEVVRDTTRSERFWNWLGSVPHWIYPTILREHPREWRETVIWISAGAVAAAITGAVLGIWRMRWRRRANGGLASPYRGWMAWHHWTSLAFALFILAWIVSGLLSMNPGRVFASPAPPRDALAAFAGVRGLDGLGRSPVDALVTGGPSSEVERCDGAAEAHAPIAEIDLRFVSGTLWLIAHSFAGSTRAIRADQPCAAFRAISTPRLVEAAAGMVPGYRIVDWSILEHYDAYYYSRRGRRVLPVLRVRFDDPPGTWYHIDPATGRVIDRMDRSRRAYRWLFHAPHSLDFPGLYGLRPLWDVVIVCASVGGLVASITGVVIGWRRLRSRNRGRGRTARGSG